MCVNAVMHGNEICGAIVLDKLLRTRFARARAISPRFVNVDAFLRFDDGAPQLSFVDEDMNRVWTEERLDSKDQSVELTRARQRTLFDEVDYLLDILDEHAVTADIALQRAGQKVASRRHEYLETVACGSGPSLVGD